MSGIHCLELGINLAVRSRQPQAGVGTAAGPCLTIRRVACERATPAMIHPTRTPFAALLTSTCTKKVEVSQTPTLVPERTHSEGAARQNHSSNTAQLLNADTRTADATVRAAPLLAQARRAVPGAAPAPSPRPRRLLRARRHRKRLHMTLTGGTPGPSEPSASDSDSHVEGASLPAGGSQPKGRCCPGCCLLVLAAQVAAAVDVRATA
jgi:hypothetical protein